MKFSSKSLWLVNICIVINLSLNAQVPGGRKLSEPLREISGITKEKGDIWAIADDSRSDLFRLSTDGALLQHVKITGANMQDIEAVTSDADYIYVGDVGDNAGIRPYREILRINRRDALKNNEAKAEIIRFNFPGDGEAKKKKSNNHDCEAMIAVGDSIYLFTKRRDDLHTRSYSIPNRPGIYTAIPGEKLKVKGLITDASLSPDGKELALIGYEEGHRQAFVYLIKDFSKNNYFSGTHDRYLFIKDKKLDWQVESIAYNSNDEFIIACERTKDVPASLYFVKKSELIPE